MPITLFSGLPGAGKTAQLVAEILRLTEAEPGRPIFAFGINGLKDGLAIPLTEEMLHRWPELPPGSIIAIDECQEDGSNPDQPVSLMPKDRGMPAPWVQRITKVRHYGMDFLLTTQDPVNMSAYVRRLVDKHVHTIRKFGTTVVQRYTWGRCIDDPYNRRSQKEAVSEISTLPSKVFDMYRSSQLHTMKRKIPFKVYLFLAVAVVTVGAVVAVPFVLHRVKDKSVGEIAPKASLASQDSSGHLFSGSDALREKDMVKWMQPRVVGLPWSAPMFDKLQVQAQPRLYCIADENGGCKCETEQGTAYDVPAKTCRSMVANGVYNPFLPPQQQTTGPASSSSTDDPGRRAAASPLAGPGSSASVADDAGSGAAWKSSRLRAPYTPPELMAPNDPIKSGTGM